jgi:hypothetical protein
VTAGRNQPGPAAAGGRAAARELSQHQGQLPKRALAPDLEFLKSRDGPGRLLAGGAVNQLPGNIQVTGVAGVFL